MHLLVRRRVLWDYLTGALWILPIISVLVFLTALALAWGLSWLAVGRLSGEPANEAIGIAAIVVAAIVLLVPLAVAGLRLLRPEHD